MSRSSLVRFVSIVIAIVLSAADVDATILQSKVVDAETNEPIEGAVVVVVWMRPVFFPCMDSCSAFHDAADTVSDAQGNFRIDISMGSLAHKRDITIYKPGYSLPSYKAAPWLFSTKDPPPVESQVVRLIRSPSLRGRPGGHALSPNICLPNDGNRWCVPQHKVKNYVQLNRMIGKIQDSGPLFPEQYTDLPPLHAAVVVAKLDSVRSLLDGSANPNEPDKEGRTPLMLLTKEIFINKTVRRSMTERHSGPPAYKEMIVKQHQEASMRSEEIFRVLLAAGGDPNVKSKNGDTALVFAIPTGRDIGGARGSRYPDRALTAVHSPELVQELLAAGANPNIQLAGGLTPLMLAAGRELAQIVDALLSNGADVNLKADFGLTALDVAVGDNAIEALKKARGPRKRLPPPPGTTAQSTNNLLREAALSGNARVVRAVIVEEGAEPNFQENPSEPTALYYGIRSGNVATVETLLKLGANPNITVPNSGTPLAFASKALKPELAIGIIKALVDGGATDRPAK